MAVVIPPAIRAIPAVAFTILCGIISVRSFELSSLITLQVLLILHPMYYWSMFRPALFPAWAGFLLGLSVELVDKSLLGLSAFMMVLAGYTIMRQRRYLLSQPFATQWAGFLVLCLVFEGVRWLAMCAVNGTLFSPASAGASAICNAALYPLSSLVMLASSKLISPDTSGELLSD